MSTVITIGNSQVRIPTDNGEGLPLLDWGSGVSTAIQLLASGLNSVSPSNNVNHCVNGGFEVWNRGLSFYNPANNAYTADKWRMSYNSTPDFSVDAISTPSTVDSGFYCHRVNIFNTASATVFNVYQDIELAQNYKGKVVTFSARISSSISAIVGLRITDNNGSTVSAFYSGSTNYETLVCTRTLGADVLTLKIEIGFFGWSPIAGVISMDSAGLYVSNTSPGFTPYPRSTDEIMCARYYEKQTAIYHDFYSTTGTRVFFPVKFAVPKPFFPSITLTSGSLTNLSSLAAVNINQHGFQIQGAIAGTGLAQWGNGAWFAQAS